MAVKNAKRVISVEAAEEILRDFDFRAVGMYLEGYLRYPEFEIDWTTEGEELFITNREEGTIWDRTSRYSLLHEHLQRYWEDFCEKLQDEGKVESDGFSVFIPEEAFDAYVTNRLVRFLQDVGWDRYFNTQKMLKDVERVLGWYYLD